MRAFAAILVVASACSSIPVRAIADESVALDASRLEWMREYLAEFSNVTEREASGTRDVLWTRIEKHPEPGVVLLTYQRATYEPGETEPRIRQFIHYTIDIGDLDPGTVSMQAWKNAPDGRQCWLVRVATGDGADFIPYTNVFERRQDGGVDVSSSRGRVREVALGYFDSETVAARFADTFRDVLESLDA